MSLCLTSDFPATPNDAVAECIRSAGANPRVAWVPPFTAMGRARFPAAAVSFQSLGVLALEYCDIDEEANEHQLAHLDEYDVVYLTGGDPLGFRRNILRCGFSEQLREYVAAGRLLIAASGGAMQFTRNVSVFRLLSATVDQVVAERDEYEGLGIVGYEILPHLNKLEAAFLEDVQRYSELVPHDVVALEDGAALIHSEGGAYRCIGGAIRFRNGVRTSIATAA